MYLLVDLHFAWTDLTIQLNYLANQPSSCATFVVNRVARMQENSWLVRCHVQTHANTVEPESCRIKHQSWKIGHSYVLHSLASLTSGLSNSSTSNCREISFKDRLIRVFCNPDSCYSVLSDQTAEVIRCSRSDLISFPKFCGKSGKPTGFSKTSFWISILDFHPSYFLRQITLSSDKSLSIGT